MNEPPTKRPIFVFVSAYVMGKETADPIEAVRLELAAGEAAQWPGFRTVARLRKLSPIVLLVNHSSLIAKARSLGLGKFLEETECDRMICVDDDIDAGEEDLRKLKDAAPIDILIAPCALRAIVPGGEPHLNIVTTSTPPRARDAGGVPVFSIVAGGFALSAITREAADKMYRELSGLRFVDHVDGGRGLGIFLEEIEQGAWIGEDFMACARARSLGLKVEALCESNVTHAGVMACVDPSYFRSLDS